MSYQAPGNARPRHISLDAIRCCIAPAEPLSARFIQVPNYYCTSIARERGQNLFHCHDKSLLLAPSDLTQLASMVPHQVLSRYSAPEPQHLRPHRIPLPTARTPNLVRLHRVMPTPTDICGGPGIAMVIMITIATSDWGGFAYLRLELHDRRKKRKM